MTLATTTQPLTNETLTYWMNWYHAITSKLKPLRTLEEAGTYWVYYGSLCFTDLSPYSIHFQQEVISKVSKLKVGDKYRRDIEGWIVPDELVEEFQECIKISKLYTELRRDAINVISKADWNGYSRVKNLSPEKMQTLIDIFSDQA